MPLEKMLKEATSAMHQLEERMALLKALPSDLPLNVMFKMGDVWHLTLDDTADVQLVLQQLPPAPVTIKLDGDSQPTFVEIPTLDPRVLPFWTSANNHAWFSTVGTARVKVSVPVASKLMVPDDFQPINFAHYTVYLRKRIKMSLTPTPAAVAAQEGLNENDARNAVIRLAASAVRDYLEQHAKTQQNRPRADVLTYVAQHATGTAIAFTSRGARATGPNHDFIRHEFWIQYLGFHESFTFDIAAVYDPNGIDWLLPPGIQYRGM